MIPYYVPRHQLDDMDSFSGRIIDKGRFGVSFSYEDLMAGCALYAVFAGPCGMIFASRADYSIFYAMNTIVFIAFCVELVVLSIYKSTLSSILEASGYFLSIYFWTDLIATVVMVFNLRLLGFQMETVHKFVRIDHPELLMVLNILSLLRLIRVFRTNIDIHKILIYPKLDRIQNCETVELLSDEESHVLVASPSPTPPPPAPSRIGFELYYLTELRIVLIIFIILLILPFLWPIDSHEQQHYSIQLLHKYHLLGNQNLLTSYNIILNNQFQDLLSIHLYPENISYGFQSDSFIDSLHAEDVYTITYSTTTHNNTLYQSKGIFSNIKTTHEQGIAQLILTVIVAFLLVIFVKLIKFDLKKILLDYIDHMIEFVKIAAKNPFDIDKLEDKNVSHDVFVTDRNEYGKRRSPEILLLQNSFEKITHLLRIGFGEAGSNIISSHLQMNDIHFNNNNKEGNDVTDSNILSIINPLMAGQLVCGIFCFCTISDFENINNHLRSDILSFVNRIAHIVHNEVDSRNGSVNKNLGQGFLLVWSIGTNEDIYKRLKAISVMNSNYMKRKRSAAEESNASDVVISHQPTADIANSFSNNESQIKSRKNSSVFADRRPSINFFGSSASILELKLPTEKQRSHFFERQLSRVEPQSSNSSIDKSLPTHNLGIAMPSSTLSLETTTYSQVAETKDAHESSSSSLVNTEDTKNSNKNREMIRNASSTVEAINTNPDIPVTVPVSSSQSYMNSAVIAIKRIRSSSIVQSIHSGEAVGGTTGGAASVQSDKVHSLETTGFSSPRGIIPISPMNAHTGSPSKVAGRKKSSTFSFLPRSPSVAKRALENDQNDEIGTEGNKSARGRKASLAMNKIGGDEIPLYKIPGVEEISSRALLSILRILIEVNRSKDLKSYLDEQLRTDGNEGISNKIKLNFGIDAGWAIQGAVGSVHKIDATYLSPFVNNSSRLCAYCRVYNVPLLIAEDFYDTLPSTIRTKCRQIDRIVIKGNTLPINIYTFDLMLPNNPIDIQFQESGDTSNSDSDSDDSDSQSSSLLDDDEVRKYRLKISSSFLNLYKEGLDAYMYGDWGKACKLFDLSDRIMEDFGGDLPSRSLVSFMKQYGGIAPNNWKGYREFNSK